MTERVTKRLSGKRVTNDVATQHLTNPAMERVTKELTTLRVNGESHTVAAEPHHTLLEVLREELGLTGTDTASDEQRAP